MAKEPNPSPKSRGIKDAKPKPPPAPPRKRKAIIVHMTDQGRMLYDDYAAGYAAGMRHRPK